MILSQMPYLLTPQMAEWRRLKALRRRHRRMERSAIQFMVVARSLLLRGNDAAAQATQDISYRFNRVSEDSIIEYMRLLGADKKANLLVSDRLYSSDHLYEDKSKSEGRFTKTKGRIVKNNGRSKSYCAAKTELVL
jgi:hypothetical protein